MPKTIHFEIEAEYPNGWSSVGCGTPPYQTLKEAKLKAKLWIAYWKQFQDAPKKVRFVKVVTVRKIVR